MSSQTDKPEQVYTGKSRYRGKSDYRLVFEDKHLVVVNKPPGILTVPIKGMKAFNLIELLERDFRHKYTIKAAHRIDRFTSGLVAFSLNKKAHQQLSSQFRNRSPERMYLAVVRGIPEKQQGSLVHHLKQVKAGFRNVVTSPDDKQAGRAELHYEVMETYGDRSLVKITLVTGMKNQIRVQFAEIGHPLLGDRHYESSEKQRQEIDRQALHASELAFSHPLRKQLIRCRAELPPDMKNLLE